MGLLPNIKTNRVRLDIDVETGMDVERTDPMFLPTLSVLELWPTTNRVPSNCEWLNFNNGSFRTVCMCLIDV